MIIKTPESFMKQIDGFMVNHVVEGPSATFRLQPQLFQLPSAPSVPPSAPFSSVTSLQLPSATFSFLHLLQLPSAPFSYL
jgi:hypothetical protein